MSKIKDQLDKCELVICSWCGDIVYNHDCNAIPRPGDDYEFNYICDNCSDNYAKEVENGRNI